MKKQWCTFTEIDDKIKKQLSTRVIFARSFQPRPKRTFVRCPSCNKRLMVNWFDCGDIDCWHPMISKHKEK